jgi:hypothetical protein
VADRFATEPPADADPLAVEWADAVRHVLAEPSTWAEPPAGGADALIAAIRAEQATGPTAPAPAGPRRRWGRALVGGAVAAGLLLVGGLVGALLAGGDGAGDGDDDRGDGPGSGEVAGATFALEASGAAPAATGRATVRELEAGVAIRLDVTGLPPAPDGTYYEGWLRAPDGAAVSVGTFHMRGGDGSVGLWSGVRPDRYPQLTVTLEREGDGDSSSGAVVLRGTVAG